MNKPVFLLLSSVLALSVAACDTAKTSSDAPNSTANSPTNVDKETTQTSQDDATSELRRKQLNADMRASEQRNNAMGDKSVKADNDIKSQVRSKLEANLPASALAVDSEDGAVTVTGTVVDENQLQKIEPLTKEIGGVKSITVKAVAKSAAKPAPPEPGTNVPIKEQTGSKN